MNKSATIAIMQPYFFPYGGYYRLLASADIFVIFDCVQFPRRGWVHRNRLHNAHKKLDWLTLPIEKADYHASIASLKFQKDAHAEMRVRMGRFPALGSVNRFDLLNNVANCSGSVTDYLELTLRETVANLGLSLPYIIRSSQLTAPTTAHAADRIVWIAQQFGAGTYVNAPGGRDLYQNAQFDTAGLKLRFLKPYVGPSTSLLERICIESPAEIRNEILRQCELEN